MSRTGPFRLRPSAHFNFMVDSMKERTFFLVQQQGPTKFNIRDESDKKFKISIGSNIRCSCGGGEIDHCMHTVYIITQVLGVPEDCNLRWQVSFLDQEVAQLLEFREQKLKREEIKRLEREANALQENVSVACDNGKRLPIEDDDCCPICQDILIISPQSAAQRPPGAAELFYCDEGCGRAVHLKCGAVWARHKFQSGDHRVNCPMCRCDWTSEATREIEQRMEEARKFGVSQPNYRARNAGRDGQTQSGVLSSKPISTVVQCAQNLLSHQQQVQQDTHFGFKCKDCSMAPVRGPLVQCLVCPRGGTYCSSCCSDEDRGMMGDGYGHPHARHPVVVVEGLSIRPSFGSLTAFARLAEDEIADAKNQLLITAPIDPKSQTACNRLVARFDAQLELIRQCVAEEYAPLSDVLVTAVDAADRMQILTKADTLFKNPSEMAHAVGECSLCNPRFPLSPEEDANPRVGLRCGHEVHRVCLKRLAAEAAECVAAPVAISCELQAHLETSNNNVQTSEEHDAITDSLNKRLLVSLQAVQKLKDLFCCPLDKVAILAGWHRLCIETGPAVRSPKIISQNAVIASNANLEKTKTGLLKTASGAILGSKKGTPPPTFSGANELNSSAKHDMKKEPKKSELAQQAAAQRRAEAQAAMDAAHMMPAITRFSENSFAKVAGSKSSSVQNPKLPPINGMSTIAASQAQISMRAIGSQPSRITKNANAPVPGRLIKDGHASMPTSINDNNVVNRSRRNSLNIQDSSSLALTGTSKALNSSQIVKNSASKMASDSNDPYRRTFGSDMTSSNKSVQPSLPATGTPSSASTGRIGRIQLAPIGTLTPVSSATSPFEKEPIEKDSRMAINIDRAIMEKSNSKARNSPILSHTQLVNQHAHDSVDETIIQRNESILEPSLRPVSRAASDASLKSTILNNKSDSHHTDGNHATTTTTESSTKSKGSAFNFGMLMQQPHKHHITPENSDDESDEKLSFNSVSKTLDQNSSNLQKMNQILHCDLVSNLDSKSLLEASSQESTSSITPPHPLFPISSLTPRIPVNPRINSSISSSVGPESTPKSKLLLLTHRHRNISDVTLQSSRTANNVTVDDEKNNVLEKQSTDLDIEYGQDEQIIVPSNENDDTIIMQREEIKNDANLNSAFPNISKYRKPCEATPEIQSFVNSTLDSMFGSLFKMKDQIASNSTEDKEKETETETITEETETKATTVNDGGFANSELIDASALADASDSSKECLLSEKTELGQTANPTENPDPNDSINETNDDCYSNRPKSVIRNDDGQVIVDVVTASDAFVQNIFHHAAPLLLSPSPAIIFDTSEEQSDYEANVVIMPSELQTNAAVEAEMEIRVSFEEEGDENIDKIKMDNDDTYNSSPSPSQRISESHEMELEIEPDSIFTGSADLKAHENAADVSPTAPISYQAVIQRMASIYVPATIITPQQVQGGVDTDSNDRQHTDALDVNNSIILCPSNNNALMVDEKSKMRHILAAAAERRLHSSGGSSASLTSTQFERDETETKNQLSTLLKDALRARKNLNSMLSGGNSSRASTSSHAACNKAEEIDFSGWRHREEDEDSEIPPQAVEDSNVNDPHLYMASVHNEMDSNNNVIEGGMHNLVKLFNVTENQPCGISGASTEAIDLSE